MVTKRAPVGAKEKKLLLCCTHDIPFLPPFVQQLRDAEEGIKVTTSAINETDNCRDARAPIMFLNNPNVYLNIESSHWILELETTSQHRSWWLWIRFVTTLDGNQPWIIPGFVSSASPFFLCPPPESQRWTYPSLQNLQTAEKLHIRGEGQQKKRKTNHRVVGIFLRTPEPSWVETNVEFPWLNLKHWLHTVRKLLLGHLIGIHICGKVAGVHQALLCQREVASVSWHQPRCIRCKEKEEKHAVN